MITMLWFLVATLCKFVIATEFIPGKRLPDINGKTCKSGDELFVTSSGSPMQCLLECGKFSGDARCRSAFYRESDGRCQGCSKWYTTLLGLPDSAGTVYLGKGAGWDQSSDSDAECMFARRQINSGACRCIPGWPYDFQAKRCVKRCENWGTTYEEYTGSMLQGLNNGFEQPSTIPSCIEKCNLKAKCYSIDFNVDADLCITNGANAAMEPSEYIYGASVSYYTHLTRNCA